MFDLPDYPGRGIAVHRHHSGQLEWIYFLTGRSDASRQRTLHAESDRVLVVPTDEIDAPDPLRHYACVRAVGSVLIIGNGDHVDQIADAFLPMAHHSDDPGDDGVDQQALSDVVRGLEAEPDPPIHTPRIAVVARDGSRPAEGDEAVVHVGTATDPSVGRLHRVLTAELAVGEGILVHTYGGGIDDVIGDAEVRRFTVERPGTDVAGRLWHALDPELRVALAVGIVPAPIPERVLTERR